MVSIIVPFYNSEKYIEQCLLSVQAQTYMDIEVLCVSDGSEDGSEMIVRELADRDPRFRLIRRPKSSAGQARNTGIKHAKGEWLCFLDSDDFLSSDMIEKMLGKCEETGCDICFCDADTYHDVSGEYFYLKNRCIKEYYLPNMMPFHPFEISDFIFQVSIPVPWGKFFRTAFVKESKIWFPSIPRSEDVFFVNMLFAIAQRIAFTTEVLVHHRVGITSNLQSGYYKTPTTYSQVIKAIYRGLRDRNIYTIYERSFLRSVVGGTGFAFERILTDAAALDDFAGSCRQIYKELNLFEALLNIGNFLVERQDRIKLDAVLGYVTDLNSLKQMDIYDESLENVFLSAVNILREKYVEVLQQLPLNEGDRKIGFYGAGKHTQGLLAIYKKLIGKIEATVVYITSEESSDSCVGMKNISYKEIDDSFDAIVISSFIYNDEMFGNLSNICCRTHVVSFYPQYKQDVFAIFCEKDGLINIL